MEISATIDRGRGSLFVSERLSGGIAMNRHTRSNRHTRPNRVIAFLIILATVAAGCGQLDKPKQAKLQARWPAR